MPTTIRLKRVGRKKQSAFRIVVIDSSRAVGGPAIERLGIYNPRTQPSVVRLDAVRTLHWLYEGAEPSDTVRSILRQTGLWEKFHQRAGPEDLEEAVILRGPGPGRHKTSQRPLPPKEGRTTPGPEAGAEEEPIGEPEEGPAAKVAAGTEASDEAREASAVPAEEETEPAAPPVPEAEAGEARAEAGEAEEKEVSPPEAGVEEEAAPEAGAEEEAAPEASAQEETAPEEEAEEEDEEKES